MRSKLNKSTGVVGLTCGLLAALTLTAPAARAQSTIQIPADSQTRTTSYDYHPDGRLRTERVEPTGPQSVRLTTVADYPAGTSQKRLTSTGWDGAADVSRTTTTDFGSDGRFPRSSTNALTHSESFDYDARFARVSKHTDLNGLVTRVEFDSFGRKTFERRGYANDAATTYTDYTRWTYERCSQAVGGCPSVQGVVPVTVITTSVYSSADAKLAPTKKSYLDRLNREVRAEVEVLNGGSVRLAWTDTVFNARGLVERVSLPYFSTDTPGWTNFQYDDLGRRTQETSPSGLVTTVSYTHESGSIDRSPLTVTTTVYATEGTRARVVRHDWLGEASEIVDANSKSVNFAYNAFGNRTHTVDHYGNVISTEYDIRGRETRVTDPDFGAAVTFSPNAFGELASEIDGLGRTTTRTHDLLGRVRMVNRVDGVATFEYDAAAKGVGKLNRTYTDNGYCRTHSYDTLGRPDTTAVSFGGTTPCTTPTQGSFASSTTYDSAGRVDTARYPTGVTLKYTYNTTLGFVERVHNHTGNAVGATYWQWQESDALGRTTVWRQGNTQTLRTYQPSTTWLDSIMTGSGGNAGLADIQLSSYAYNSVGDLRMRADRFQLPGMVEQSEHDALGRLRSYARFAEINGGELTGTRINIDYDAIGNVKSRTDVGTYYYNPQGPTSLRPHAVAEIRGAVNASLTYATGTGNLTTGAGRTYQYDSRNLVTEVGNAANCHRFLYQGEGVRSQQTVHNTGCSYAGGSNVVSQTLYLHPDAANGLAFEREVKGGTTNYKHYINAGGMVVGVLTTTSANVTSNSVGTITFFHYDHLGSIVAISNASGQVVERRSFDPWGRARDVNGTPSNGELPGGSNAVTDRGFTLHEHLEGLGLVHMNGRVYDFTVGRFVSPDPTVPRPDDLQSYNRYSYVSNRPLNSVDPTGFADESAGSGWSWLNFFAQSGPGSSTQAGIFFGFGFNGSSWGPMSGYGSAAPQFAPSKSYNTGMDYAQTASSLENALGSTKTQANGHQELGLATRHIQARLDEFVRSAPRSSEEVRARVAAVEALIAENAAIHRERGISTASNSLQRDLIWHLALVSGSGNALAGAVPLVFAAGGGALVAGNDGGAGGAGRGILGRSVSGGTAKGIQTFRNLAPADEIVPAVLFPASQVHKVGYSGRLTYVVKESGELVIGRTPHTSLSRGADVLAAGEARFVNGTLRSIDNASGHYRPSGAAAQRAAEAAFGRAGFDAAGKYIERSF